MTANQLAPKLVSFASEIDQLTIDQAKQTASLDFVYPHVALMPDAHWGMGSSVGSVIPTRGAVIPAAVGVDIGCLDAETEVLTPIGWTPISKWDGQDIMVYRPDTDRAWFAAPQAYIDLPCDEFYYFKNSRGLDQMLSVEHRIPVWSGFKKRGYTFSVHSPESLIAARLQSGYHSFKTTFTPESAGIDITDAQIRLEVMVQADGRTRSSRNRNCVELHFRKARKIARARALLEEAGVRFTETQWNNGTTLLSFSVPHGECTKDLRRFWLASANQLRVVADEVLNWDGHRGYRSTYTNTNRSAADVVQYAFAATGVRAGIHSRDPVNDHWSRTHHVIPTRNEMVAFDYPTLVPSADGRKYCFTTATGFFVARRNGKIFITGNCGMSAIRTRFSKSDIPEKAALSELRALVESAIPLSPGNYNNSLQRFGFTHARLNELEKQARETGVDLSHSGKWMQQLGSLGGGNHFIELCLDQNDTIWLILHSGSRGVGNKIAQRHIKVAKGQCKNEGLPHPDLAYLIEGTDEFESYITELRWAQHFALLNRDEMVDRFKQVFAQWMGVQAQRVELERVRSHHNYTVPIEIDGQRVWLTRKGAVDAHVGMKSLIPGSMGTRSYVVTGKGNPLGLWSAPHGAGRRYSRKKAKELFSEQDLAEAMVGIEYRHGAQWIDEIPGAYKDIDVVMEDSKDLLTVDYTLRQILNCKGT